MKNPFTMNPDHIPDRAEKEKINKSLKKQSGKPVETKRSKGGGGRKGAGSQKVSNNKEKRREARSSYQTFLKTTYEDNYGIIKRLTKEKLARKNKNKVARRSRRINRLRKAA